MRRVVVPAVVRRAVLLFTIAGVWLAAQQTARHTEVSSYEGPEGHQMIVIEGGEFTMGSPVNEPGRSATETPHRVRIPRLYAIATKEVTNEQFNRFVEAAPDYGTRWKSATAARFGDPPRFQRHSRTPNSP